MVVLPISNENSKSPLVIEIQGKTKDEVNEAKQIIESTIGDMARSYYFGEVDIKKELLRFIVGRAGAGVRKFVAKEEWQGAVVDLLIPSEGDDDGVVIVLKGDAASKLGGKGGIQSFLNRVKEDLIKEGERGSEFHSMTVSVEPRFVGRLIGKGGGGIQDLVSGIGEAGSVNVQFGGNRGKGKKEGDTTSSTFENGDGDVIVKGPKKEVEQVVDRIKKLVDGWKHTEFMSGYCETIRVAPGIAKKLGGSGSIVRHVRETLEKGVKGIEGNPSTLVSSLKINMEEGDKEDTITITGLKDIVQIAHQFLDEKAKRIADEVKVQIILADVLKGESNDVSKSIKKFLSFRGPLKRIMEKWSVHIKVIRHGNNTSINNRQEMGTGTDRSLHDSIEELSLDDIDNSNNNNNNNTNDDRGEVVIIGHKDSVSKAKTDLIGLAQWELDHSYSIEVEVPSETIPRIVGRGGAGINKIREECDVKVDINESKDRVTVVIEGTKNGCEKAKKMVNDIVEGVVSNIITFLFLFLFFQF